MHKSPYTVIAAAALAALAASAAHADEKIVQSIAIQNPQIQAMLKSLSPEQKEQMSKMGIGGEMVITSYFSGSKVRSDNGIISTIVDPAAGKVITINRESHTYATTPYNPNAMQAGQGVTSKITPTNQYKRILGHSAQRYLLAISGPSIPGGHISGDLWAAQDLAMPPVPSVGSGPAAVIQSQLRKIKKLPLVTTITMTGRNGANTKMTAKVLSYAAGPIPASVFAVPAGYTPGPAAPAIPGMPGAGQ